MRRKEFWVKNDGSFERVEHSKVLIWARKHPGKGIKIVDVGRKQIGIYTITADARGLFEFDGAYIGRQTLALILKSAGE